MELETILSAISTVGFPIACCIGIFWYLQKEQQAHKEEMAAVTKALHENTLVLTELKDLFAMMTGYKKGRNTANETGQTGNL